MNHINFKSANENFFIVHFDDHQLFSTGLRNALKGESKYLIESINEYSVALRFITDSLKNGNHIDLVITDFNHPGPNGYEFALEVQNIAKLYGTEIPVLLLTMSTLENPKIVKGLEEGIFSKHLTKAANSGEIIETIESLCSVESMDSSIVNQEKNTQETTMSNKKTSLNWLRWIAVLPAAILALILAEAIFNLINLLNVWFFGWRSDSPYMLVVNVIAAGIGGNYCISVGSSIAPSYKKMVGLILMILVVLCMGIVIALCIQTNSWKNLILAAACTIGSVIAYVNVIDVEY